MAKHQPYSRDVLRGLRVDWARRNRGLVVSGAFIVVSLIAALTIWVVVFSRDSRLAWYVLGTTQAVLVGLFVHALHTGFLLTDRDGIHQLRGAWGEENTRSELETAKRRRLVWGWVDNVSLQRGDIDHVVITRSAGVLVLDSKWRNKSDSKDTLDMAAAARRVQLRAEGVARTILVSERQARHRARMNSVAVRAAVVIWGAEQHRLPGGFAQIDGIDFVAGRHLRTWIAQLDGDPVSREAAKQLVSLLEEFRSTASEGRLERRS